MISDERDQGGGGTYPGTIQDEFGVCLVIFDGLCSQSCGTRVELEDVGRHGSMGGRWGRFWGDEE